MKIDVKLTSNCLIYLLTEALTSSILPGYKTDAP